MWSPCLLHQSLWDTINYFYFIVRQNRKEPSPLPIAPHPSCQLKNPAFLGCFHKRRAKPYAIWGVHLQEFRSRMWPKGGMWLLWLPKPGQASFHQDVPQCWPFTNNTKNHTPGRDLTWTLNLVTFFLTVFLETLPHLIWRSQPKDSFPCAVCFLPWAGA